MTIDWSKAPKWAEAHALYAYGGEISEVWGGAHKYQRVDFPNSYPYGGGNTDHQTNPVRSQFRYETARPAVWNGEGLPPVGTVCEIIPHNTLWGFSVLDTYPSTILAYHSDFAWIDVGVPGVPVSTRTDKVDFRPIRTAEQIEAAEREEAINELASSIGRGTFIQDATHIYDKLGYRKQVAP